MSLDPQLIHETIRTHQEMDPGTLFERAVNRSAEVATEILPAHGGKLAVTALAGVGGMGAIGIGEASAASLPPNTVQHVVRPGETLSGIAYQVAETSRQSTAAVEGQIDSLNGIKDPDLIKVGEDLIVPANTPASAAVVVAPVSSPTHPEIIQAGQTVWALGQQQGFSVQAFASVNPGVNPNHVRAGQSYNIPNEAADTAPQAPVAPANAAVNTIKVTVPAGGSEWGFAESLSQKTGAPVTASMSEIAADNPGISDPRTQVQAGEQLTVPAQLEAPVATPPTPPAETTPVAPVVAATPPTPPAAVAAVAPPSAPPTPTPQPTIKVTVPAGGSEWGFAESLSQKTGAPVTASMSEIAADNPGISDPRTQVQAGEQLTVPAQAATAPYPDSPGASIIVTAPNPSTAPAPAEAPASSAEAATSSEVTPGPYYLEKYAVAVLTKLAATMNVPLSSTLTEEHVTALVTWASVEQGDIANSDTFNCMNTGIDDPALLASGPNASGLQAFKSFDAGVEGIVNTMTAANQNRLAQSLSDPTSTAEDFIHALTYYQDYPGNDFWAQADTNNPAQGWSQTTYYNGLMGTLQAVRTNYPRYATIQIGHDYDKDKGLYISPTLLQYNGQSAQ